MESLGTSLSMDKRHIYITCKLIRYILPIISYNHPKNTAVQQKLMQELVVKYSNHSERILKRTFVCIQPCSLTFELHVFHKFLTRASGAIYRYYESRRRKVNDSRSDRQQQVMKNNLKTKKRQNQRNVRM